MGKLTSSIGLPVWWVFIGGSTVVAKPSTQCPGLGVGLDVLFNLLVGWRVFVDRPVAEDVT
jgi:hypothetical protein